MPIPARFFENYSGSLAETSRAFPLAGLVAALPPAAFLLIALLIGVPNLLAAALAILLLIGICGGLHEDGLADVADGFFGGKDPESRLDIMKDSRIGAYGALALVFSVLLRVATLSSIASTDWLSGAIALVAASVAGRTALVWHWSELASARPGGTADSAGQPVPDSVKFALASGLPLALLASIIAAGVNASILALALATLVSIGFVRLCRDKIGGHTGDTLGASAQIAEIASLIALATTL